MFLTFGDFEVNVAEVRFQRLFGVRGQDMNVARFCCGGLRHSNEPDLADADWLLLDIPQETIT